MSTMVNVTSPGFGDVDQFASVGIGGAAVCFQSVYSTGYSRLSVAEPGCTVITQAILPHYDYNTVYCVDSSSSSTCRASRFGVLGTDTTVSVVPSAFRICTVPSYDNQYTSAFIFDTSPRCQSTQPWPCCKTAQLPPPQSSSLSGAEAALISTTHDPVVRSLCPPLLASSSSQSGTAHRSQSSHCP